MSKMVDQLAELIINRLEEAGDLHLLPELVERLGKRARLLEQGTRVISAVPLTGEQQEELKQGLEGAEVNFVVDPTILGGLILEHEGRRTDLSWRSRLGE